MLLYILFIIILLSMSQVHLSTLAKGDFSLVTKYLRSDSFHIRKIFKRIRSQIIIIQQLLNNRNLLGFDSVYSHKCVLYIHASSGYLIAETSHIDTDSIIEQSREWLISNREKLIQTFILKILKGNLLYMYTLENVFFNPYTTQVLFNQISISGLIPILLKKSFTRKEFAETYELLDVNMFQEVTDRKQLITYKTKFRAIGMIVLHLIMKKRVSLLLERDLPEEFVSFEQAAKLVNQLKQRFAQLLTLKTVVDKINEAEERDQVNYFYFLRRVFYENCENMTWTDVINLLTLKFTSNSSKKQSSLLFNLVQKIFSEEDKQRIRKLAKLGITNQTPEIYLHYQLDTTSLRFESIGDLISQNFMSPFKVQLFTDLGKLIMKRNEDCSMAIDNDSEQSKQLSEQCQILAVEPKRPQIESPIAKKNKPINKIFTSYVKYQISTKQQEQQIKNFDKYYDDTETHLERSQDKNSKQQTEKRTINPQSILSSNELAILQIMVNNFKTNVAEVQGNKIYGMDPNIGMINRYLKL